MSIKSPFEDAIHDLRVSGSVVLHESYAPPWAIDVPAEQSLRAITGAANNVRIIPFHLVKRGAFQLQFGDECHDVSRGHVVLCAGGQAHRMQQGETSKAISLETILSQRSAHPRGEGAKESTELLCGLFFLRTIPLSPILSALPAALIVRARGKSASPVLANAAEMLLQEVGRPEWNATSFTAERLLEIFCAEALRSCVSDAKAGWFRGLSDPKISAALAKMHEYPGAAWSVEGLAAAIALSPSRFAARFREVIGESPISYLTRWRMTLACRLLEETDNSIDAIAQKVGYGAVSSFSRSFRNLVGTPPAKWRSERREKN